MKETWYHCILYEKEPYVCFGIAVRNGVVIQAAPVVSWMLGKKLTDLTNYFKKSKALVTEVKTN